MATITRFIAGPGQDNTLRTVTQDVQTPAYGATIAIVTTAEKTKVNFAILTGALTVNIGVGSSTAAPYVGDTIKLFFTADATGRTVTFGTGFATTSPLVLASSATSFIEFIFNGVNWLPGLLGIARDTVDIQTPAYGASIAITTTKKTTKVIPAQLTGALTLTAVVTGALIGDILIFVFSADGTNRVVTFSTNFNSAGTLTVVASKFGSTSFCYNGTAWIETGRALTA